MDENYLDLISDSVSTGLEDRFSPYLPELYLDSDQALFEIPVIASKCEAPLLDKSITYLCDICHKTVIKLEDSVPYLPKKRKTAESQLIVASMKVCAQCRTIDIETLKTTSASNQGKIVVKRENAKRRVQEVEDLKKIKENQEQMIEENTQLSETEKKKMKQIIRNRISAQQSRDRKKEYLSQLEEENHSLKMQNNLLTHKLKEITQENEYLKTQLSGIHLNSSNHSYLKPLGLGSLLLFAIIAFANISSSHSEPEKRLLLSTENSLEINQGSELVEINTNNHLQQLRDFRLEQVEYTASDSLGPCAQNIESNKLTTLYCPKVHALWESFDTGLKHLQLILPLTSLPIIDNYPSKDAKDYMVELICSVNDLNILPIYNV